MIWLHDAWTWLARQPQRVPRFAEMDAIDTADERLAIAGRSAVAEANRLFALDVYDPAKTDKSAGARHSRTVIQQIVDDAGWTWIDYTGNGATQWCGMFAAVCWRAAGIDPSMLATFWASTIRLAAWAAYKPFNGKANPKPKTGGRRLVAKITRTTKALPFEPRAGDVLVVGDGKPAAGDHICLVTNYDAERRVFSAIEGNGSGLGPDGKKREGIVRAERPIDGAGYVAMWLYRPAPGDLL